MPKLSEILGEHFKQIPEDLQKKYKDIDLVDSSNYVEKSELETANKTIKQYKKDIEKRDKDLTDLQSKVKDNEELNTEIEQLKADNKKASEEYEAKLNQVKFENALEKALIKSKAKNNKAVKALLDIEKIKLDGENLLGFDDQIKALEESDAYLFLKEEVDQEKNKETEKPLGGTGTIGMPKGDGGKTETIGARLAKQRMENSQVPENEFFKID
ncbi:phage scaffolding protein [Hathewaya massiliensis]|uniref:phage scaffolding protein n=1 Tax=Hathewaya massiliensis TaxID=1964382 RepID=UPI001158DD5C|nr:phage scaffolding protein [Hathewaya massiliensis]